METSDRQYQASTGISGALTERRALDTFGPKLPVGRATLRQAWRIGSRIAAKRAESQHPDLGGTPLSVARDVVDVLLVDPDPDGLGAVQAALGQIADVEACSEFRAARARLMAKPPDLLVTNLRLAAYNGLHLVHLAAGTHTRCIAYAIYDDLVLAREVQAAGAFYERAKRLPLTLPSYVNALLPRHDRRNPTVLDRRLNFRGGRRCADV